MRDWRLALLVIGLQSCIYQYACGQEIDLFTLCPSLMSGIQVCADKYMPGKQTPIMAMFDPKAIGKIDLNLGSFREMCSTMSMIDQMENHFVCINTVLNITTCPALGLDLADLLNPNMLGAMKRSWKYTCQHLEVLASEAAQTCLIETNKQMLRCITKRSREKKLKDAVEEATENNSNQQDVVKLNNCIMYSLSSTCFKKALDLKGCPQNISDVAWKSVSLVIPTACTTGPYAIYNKLFSGTSENSSTSKTVSILPFVLLILYVTFLDWT
ncbi:uncharacterized protein LOC135490929 [Lineus longissimus]|uniref:uncharacterized protein LOC135490929 n=1 Tax=Lineus longissimus TaxID=88925 RepID=UPI002B4D83F3